jgi:hypothetical protein
VALFFRLEECYCFLSVDVQEDSQQHRLSVLLVFVFEPDHLLVQPLGGFLG